MSHVNGLTLLIYSSLISLSTTINFISYHRLNPQGGVQDPRIWVFLGDQNLSALLQRFQLQDAMPQAYHQERHGDICQ
jgi:hypothetical protein